MTHERSAIISFDSVVPDMILAEPIRDRSGYILLPKGTQLTEQHLASLSQRGIASACVELNPEAITAEAAEAYRVSVEARLSQIFAKNLGHAANRELYDLILEYRLGQLK